MADSAIKNEEEKKEYFDTPEELEAKIEQLALWVREASHFIAFTGAGISTSAGIPDFRSGYNTVLQTGPGAWEKKAQGKKTKQTHHVTSTKAVPTQTHMSFVKLMEIGLLKHLVSQNTDGLHRRSGIPTDKLSELHGNTNLEVCTTCKKEYMRDFRVRTAQHVHEHLTGRRCDNPQCNGQLKDTIINFGENLEEDIIDRGFRNGAEADLCLAMGSSLRVTPAADIPKNVSKHGRLVIVNLQKTPLDGRAALQIHAFCDTVMQLLMEKLGLEIPSFKLVRRLKISRGKEVVKGNLKDFLYFQGVDSNNAPYTLFPMIQVTKGADKTELKKEPMKYFQDRLNGNYQIKVNFQGHYQEPPVDITLNSASISDDSYKLYVMTFDPTRKLWESVNEIN
ncbi:unnamed protein product [Blepharisma stoltei]|uniref:Regulatory protein SIR2 homolog 7 n=1 Tax=Blepharisma stoltei TaxID=1481888 RepID=A0AAU9JH74_9CILI|nr:unnamed protein product [Blepharisma stoltei]